MNRRYNQTLFPRLEDHTGGVESLYGKRCRLAHYINDYDEITGAYIRRKIDQGEGRFLDLLILPYYEKNDQTPCALVRCETEGGFYVTVEPLSRLTFIEG